MKNYWTFALLLTLPISVFCQQIEIDKIRELHETTQSNKSTYKIVQVDDFENSSEGGDIKAYYFEDSLKLIEAKYYGETGKNESEYYFEKGKIYFSFKIDYRYNVPPSYSGYDSDKTKIDEDRYYFWNDRMIRWINPLREKVNPNTDDFSKTEKEQLEWIYEVKSKFE